jgi:ribosomal protein S18 acetylase RimI-like enzyme
MTAKYQPVIRLLTPAEAAVYRDVRLQGLKLHPEAFSSTFERESEKPLSWFEDRITQGNIFGAFVDGELIGVAGCWPQDGTKVNHKAALWGMYVLPAARNSGVGRRLVEAVVNHASTRVEQLQLSVVSANEAACRLYREMGFSEYGREMKALKQDGRYYEEILMVRFLVAGTCQNRM